MSDPVNHPKHYRTHPSGVETIQITEHFNFNLGNAIKYIWRADEKGKPLEDLEKARWYVDREIERRKRAVVAEGEPLAEWERELLRSHDPHCDETACVWWCPFNESRLAARGSL